MRLLLLIQRTINGDHKIFAVELTDEVFTHQPWELLIRGLRMEMLQDSKRTARGGEESVVPTYYVNSATL
jgi:hypothetical protein